MLIKRREITDALRDMILQEFDFAVKLQIYAASAQFVVKLAGQDAGLLVDYYSEDTLKYMKDARR